MTQNPAPAPVGASPPTAGAAGDSGIRTPVLAILFVAAFGVLLTSFPVRSLDLWTHLAAGREVLGASHFAPTWLYDVGTYATFSAVGGAGVVGVKALLCGAVAVLLLRLSSVSGWGRIPLGVTGLAVLASGSRLLVHPATASVILLAIVVWLVYRRPPRGVWPGWGLVAAFVVWSNTDGRFVFGLDFVALVWLGAVLDERPAGGRRRELGIVLARVAILVVASCCNPAHVNSLTVPPEVRSAVAALQANDPSQPVHSPFHRDYIAVLRDSSAILAYYPLLALGVISFALNRRGWRWAWFLPWLSLAVVSGVQFRAVPFFAVVAAPVTAWNLQQFFARGAPTAPTNRRAGYVSRGLTALFAVAFLVAAWPGWLQAPPYEPRRWAVEPQPALEWGADFLRRADATAPWAKDSRTLYESPQTRGALAWFCPEDRSVHDNDAFEKLMSPPDPEAGRERLRALGVSRVVVYAGNIATPSRPTLDWFLSNPFEWPVLHAKGGLVVFGWRDPARLSGADPFAGWVFDFWRLAYRPDESEVAPPAHTPATRRWSDAFWKPAPPSRPPGRDQAAVLLRRADAAARAAPFRQLRAWESTQVAGLVGAGGGWAGVAAPVDAMFRLTLLHPPMPEGQAPPAITELALALQRYFMSVRGNAPVGDLYATIRAARRAIAENPNDATAHFHLGQAYLMLLGETAEQGWVIELPQLKRVRLTQASAALNRAVALNPRLAEAHLELGRLYLRWECLDLAVDHLTAYRAIPPRSGGLQNGTRFAEAFDADLERHVKLRDQRLRDYAQDSERMSISDRATLAFRRSLSGTARDILLKSDVAAFGAQGVGLELDLLLRSGRPADVLAFTPPEVRGSLGDLTYRFFRAQAHFALGDYDEADAEMDEHRSLDGFLVPAAAIGAELGGLIGKSLLDEQGGLEFLPNVLTRALSRSDFRSRIADISQSLGLQAEITVMRGVIALEAGNIARARELFRTALSFSPDRLGGPGQLEFTGRRIAWECLALIDGK